MNRKIILVQRPQGLPKDEDFKLIEEPLNTALEIGEVLVKVEWISIDPAQRVWIGAGRSYITPVSVGSVVKGMGAGIVVFSKSPAFKRGSFVTGFLHWQEYAKVKASDIIRLPSYVNPQLHLGVLGMTGLTAYVAVNEIAKPRKKETMVVSTAAGAVGSIACQLGKIRGCRVIGISGSDAKNRWLTEIGVDGVINYKTVPNLTQALKNLCPEGIDIYIDLVGGDILDAVLLNIKKYARIVMCGAISSYNLKRAPPIRYYPLIISQSASVEGFIVWEHRNKFDIAVKNLSKWIKENKIKHKEHIVDGIENAPRALRMVMTGENFGKMVVRVEHQSPKI